MIGVLVFPNFQLLDAAGPISVFEIAARFAGQSPSIKVLAVTPGPVRSSSGVEMVARGLKPCGAITTLLVAGGEGVGAAARGDKTLNFVRTLANTGGRFGALVRWAREHLDAPLTVEDLAEQAGMSSRHFTRAFIAETGSTPSKAVERLRIEVARQRVQSSSEAIERVAQLTGFRDPERMRRALLRPFV